MDVPDPINHSKEELLEELRRMREQNELDKRRCLSLQEDLRQAKEQSLAVHKQVEQEEEYITNKLMKRLEQLKKEKQILATEVEQEEEFLTNTLQKRLEKLNREKLDLENRLEAEQEYVVNKLQKQLQQLSVEKAKLHSEKIDLENQLEAEQEYIMNKLQKQVEKLATEKKGLQKERSDLQRQVSDLGSAVNKLNREKVNLEQQMEMEEENIVNRLQRQLESLLSSLRTIETKLEARGLSLKDIGVQPYELCNDAWIYSRSSSRASSGELSRSLGSLRSGELGLGRPVAGSRRDRPLSANSNASLGITQSGGGVGLTASPAPVH